MPSYTSWLAMSHPRSLKLGWARLRKPKEGLPFTFFFKKTDENELTATK